MSNNNKWLYKFNVNREKEIDESEKTKNEKGEDITVTKKVKKNFPVTFAIKKPNRRLYEDGELFFGVALSEGIKAGLLTRQLLAKRYDNDGGFMSEGDKQRYAELYKELFEKENELQKLQLNLENLSETDKINKISNVLVDTSDIRRELQDFETSRSSIFDQTAENRAKNKTLMWWVLNLAYLKDEGSEKISSIFGDGSYEDRLNVYDAVEEKEESFMSEGVKKFAYFISFWYNGQINNEDEFKNLENLAFSKDEELETEPAKVEEAKTEVAPEKKPEVAPEKKPEVAPEKKPEVALEAVPNTE